MLETVSQSLAGRTAIVKLLPFSFCEIKDKYKELGNTTDDYLFRGFYPGLYDKKIDPALGLPNYIETNIERALRQLTQVHDLILFFAEITLLKRQKTFQLNIVVCPWGNGSILALPGISSVKNISNALG